MPEVDATPCGVLADTAPDRFRRRSRYCRLMRRRVLVALLASVLCAPLALPQAAQAAPSRKKAIWGPALRDGVNQFPIYRDLGVGIYQQTLNWGEIAPTRPANPRDPADPAYRWPSDADFAVAEAPRHGIRVSMLVMYTPGWANGGRSPAWIPDDSGDYADFLEAAAKRYPGVRLWMIWSEPSKAGNFQPLTPDEGRPLKGSGTRGPRLYARLLDRAYGRLKALNRANLVIGGNTYTAGDVRPLHFIRAMRLPNGRAPRMDLYGHNPFSLRRPNLRGKPQGSGFADFADLDTLAGWLDRHKVGRGRRLKLFLSEYTLPTDHPNYEFNFYFSHRTQARWLGEALRSARRYKRIYTLGYLSLYDQAPNAKGDEIRWGLLDHRGGRKPSYEAYKRG